MYQVIKLKIIAHKHNLYNVEQFLNQMIPQSFVEGIFIDVAFTKDEKIILLSTSTNNYMDLQNVEKNDLKNISGFSPMTLEEFLVIYTTPEKRIIINLLTSSVFMNYPKITAYINALKEVLVKFPKLDFTLASASQELVYYITQANINYHSGFIIEDGNFNYLDVDSYLLSIPLLNDKIIHQQLQNKKEVMVLVNSWDDLYEVLEHFTISLRDNTLTQSEIDQIYLIGFYPRIIYQAMQPTSKKST